MRLPIYKYIANRLLTGVTLQFLLQTNGLAHFRFLQSSREVIDPPYAPAVIGEAMRTEAED
jgi:hypothetical protein